jgi:hypothetical protein
MSQPRTVLGVRLFKRGNARCLFECQRDVVEAVHQAMLAERVEIEFHLAAVWSANFLIGEVDGQCCV